MIVKDLASEDYGFVIERLFIIKRKNIQTVIIH